MSNLSLALTLFNAVLVGALLHMVLSGDKRTGTCVFLALNVIAAVIGVTQLAGA